MSNYERQFTDKSPQQEDPSSHVTPAESDATQLTLYGRDLAESIRRSKDTFPLDFPFKGDDEDVYRAASPWNGSKG